LDADERAQRREQLLAEENTVRHRWGERVGELRGALRGEAFRLRFIPENPPVDWPPSPPPAIEVLDGEEWVSSESALTMLRARLKDLREREIPTVQAAAAETERTLGELEHRYGQLSAAHAETIREVDHDRGDLRRVDQRLASLKVDRQRHLDAQHIVKLGGTPAATLTEGRCPTCDQHWPADLLGGEEPQEPVMGIEEHLELIEQERRSLAALRKGAAAVLEERSARDRAMRERLAELRADIRAHRETLLADAKRPSVAAVREQLLAEDQVRRLEDARLELLAADGDLGELSEAFRKTRAALKELESSELSERDRGVLGRFRSTFLEQLEEYGFRSLDGVTLSEETYLPERKGFDLTHEVSASDTIRLIWAYLLGMLETGTEEPSNHPGLLVLDEPGQQEVEPASLRAFLARAAGAAEREQQVLVTVTRPIDELRSTTLDHEACVIDFGDHTRVLHQLK
jgi:DNA repair exonuclease SbcCD ATPase subunit